MSEELKRFLKSISFKYSETDFETVAVEKVVVKKSSDTYEVFLKSTKVLDFEMLDKLFKKAKKGINGEKAVKIKLKYDEYNDQDILECFKFLLNKLVKKRPSLISLLENEIEISEKTITMKLASKVEEELINDEKEKLLTTLSDYGLLAIDIKLIIDDAKKVDLTHKEIVVKETKNNDDKQVFGNKITNNEITAINNIISEINNVVVEVFTFGVEYITREKVHIISLKISDKTDSLLGKIIFFGKELSNSSKIAKKVKNNTWYRIEGKVEFDNYAKDLILNVKNMEVIDSKDSVITDDEEEKRIELHAHTMMSQMDGVVSAKNLIKQAKRFGHEAIAITDHNCLQSYPEAYQNKDGIKILYGAEMNVIDDNVTIVFNEQNYVLDDETYVVFDTETTGFNAFAGDCLIEIGAVKIKNGEIIDRFDELIDPKCDIPEKITSFTHITNEMVKGKRSEEEVLKDFLNWTKDAPMVAHNARFDISFLQSGFVKYNLGDFKNTVIDTMELSRILSPEEKKHNLSILTKRFNVPFDEESHHRADYDAEATALIFHKMIKNFTSRGIKNINELVASVDPKELMRFNRPYHLTLIAKNSVGLKNLFKIVSLANTDYLFKTPRLPRSILNKYREGILVGSGCVNGEIFNAAKNKSDDELRSMIDYYDFIEVNPPSISEYLVSMGEFTTSFGLIQNIRKIIEIADSMKKLVCATGDVHQLTKEDTIYREIIINQKTPSVGLHPLYRPGVIKVPSMHLMTTKEMLDEFSFLDDKELINKIVITNPKKIANMCEEQVIIKDKLYTPVMDNSDEITREMVWNKAHEIYGQKLPELIEDRIEKELNGIINNGYSVLYLIAQKLVKKSNDDGYFVGSRGSVGSSFVATMMGITEVNALPAHYLCPECKKTIFEENGHHFSLDYKSGYDLPDRTCECGAKMLKEGQDMPFATFLGFEAEKVPDIDLNFSGENQSSAHDYTKFLFGESNVFRAGTIGTVADKTAYGFVKGYLEYYNISMRSPEIERLSLGCVGVKRTTGQHPGGIIVIPNYMDIFDFSPYQYPADDNTNSWYTTHFDFHAIHDNVLKLDILGHDDPTMLKYLAASTNFDFYKIPFDDKGVLSLFSSPKALGVTEKEINCKTGTLGIPEFGTNFVIRMLEETKPSSFAELVKISGLSHGTDVWNGNARDLIINKTVEFKNVIGCRDDIMVSLIDYGMEPKKSFKISEFVRKGKASKDVESWLGFVEEMRAAKIPEWFIGSCGKIKYMFPKAHATAYVMMGFRVAYYKVYYPIHYYSCYFGIRCFDFDVEAMVKGEDAVRRKIAEIITKGYDASNKEKNTLDTLNVVLEMFCRGFSFKNIDILKSDGNRFVISEDEKSLYIPFRALDGLGSAAAAKIIEERNIKPFLSIEDLQMRAKLSTTTIDKLKSLGVLDSLPESSQLSLF